MNTKIIFLIVSKDENIYFSNKNNKLSLPYGFIYNQPCEFSLHKIFTEITGIETKSDIIFLGDKIIDNISCQFYLVRAEINDKKNMICYNLTNIYDFARKNLLDEKSNFALYLFKRKELKINESSKIEHDAKRARQLIKEKHLNEYTNDDLLFIKHSFQGRQAFMGFFTDFSISLIMSFLLEAKNGKVLEPSCGSGRLLEYLDRSNLDITCYEIDPISIQVCKILYPNVKIIQNNALLHYAEIAQKYDYVIANSPWGLSINNDTRYKLPTLLNTQNSTIYFLEYCLHALKENGRLVILLPSLMFNKDFYKILIEFINKTFVILFQLDLPAECFSSANVFIPSTILVIERRMEKKDDVIRYKKLSIENIKCISNREIIECNLYVHELLKTAEKIIISN